MLPSVPPLSIAELSLYRYYVRLCPRILLNLGLMLIGCYEMCGYRHY